MLDREDPLTHTAILLNNVKESESSELSALEQISDTKKSIKMFEQQALAYKSLAELASIILTAVEKLSSTLKYFTFGISKFEKLIVKLISIRGGIKVCDNPMSIHANVLCLKNQLLIAVNRNLQVYRIYKFISLVSRPDLAFSTYMHENTVVLHVLKKLVVAWGQGYKCL